MIKLKASIKTEITKIARSENVLIGADGAEDETTGITNASDQT